jgi:hypothetical protein
MPCIVGLFLPAYRQPAELENGTGFSGIPMLAFILDLQRLR